MIRRIHGVRRMFGNRISCLALLTFLLIGSACDDDDALDHDPPDGQGAILVDNRTFSELRVFFNGIQQRDVDNGDVGIFNLDPGIYRVVLDEKDGDRNFRGDIDVLEDRNTVLDVVEDSFVDFDVFIYFD